MRSFIRIGDSKKLHALLKALDVPSAYAKKHAFKDANLSANLGRLLGATSMAPYKNELELELATSALAGLMDALGLMSDADGFGCYTLREGSLSSAMQLDSSAIWSLNLLPDPTVKAASGALASGAPARPGGSVLEILNRGKTAMGRRLLERWIRQPLVNLSAITARQTIVQVFVDDAALRMELLDECMKALPDLERLSVVLEKNKSVKIDDLVTVYDAAKAAIPRILSLIQSYDGPSKALVADKFTTPLSKVVDDLSGYVELIEEVVDLDTRPNVVVNAKHDDELQTLRHEWTDVLSAIDDEHTRAREAIGGDIKCERDKVREFVFRVLSKSEEARLSKRSDVHVCQVLANGVQFTTPTLKTLAAEHRRIKSTYETRQASLLRAACDVAATYVPVLEAATATLAELDVLLGFAHAACHAGSGYCRPQLEEDGDAVVLTASRHPCVELQDFVDFIPNDYDLQRETSRFQLLTGPNMGGKSTYIRTLGTIAVMAQIGSFVPATAARLPVFDKLLVRVGAGDVQQRGVSTFMVEMLEAAAILHKATRRSLVIIDELGRGTSTYDGFGLAWAISEYLLDKVRAMCLFATHFHELTALAHEYRGSGFVNKHVSAVAGEKQITMIYHVRDGACMESFGVHVAAMAGFPASVLACAKRKSDELERFTTSSSSNGDATQKRPVDGDGDDNQSSSSPAAKKARLAFMHAFAALPLPDLAADDAVAKVRALLATNHLQQSA